MAAPTPQQVKQFKEFLQDRKALVITDSSSYRPILRRICSALGMKTTNVEVAEDFATANAKILSMKPQIVFSDIKLGQHSALDLFNTLKTVYPSRLETLFFVLTESDSGAIARRLRDEEVDALLVIPFAYDTLEVKFVEALTIKMQPTEYAKLVENGKILLENQKTTEALKAFQLAQKLDSTQAHAYYHEGRARAQAGEQELALQCFAEGLKHAPNHYRCLTALFDAYMVAKNYDKALEFSDHLYKNFPIEPKRFPSFVWLAVHEGRLGDISGYYEYFSKMDPVDVDPSIVNSISAALVVCGKQFLKDEKPKEALEAFHKAESASKRKAGIMREIVTALFAALKITEAAEALSRTPDDVKNSTELILAEFNARARGSDSDSDIILLGMDIITKGIKDAKVFETVIARSITIKRRRSTIEDLITQACGACPENREVFEKMLEAI